MSSFVGVPLSIFANFILFVMFSLMFMAIKLNNLQIKQLRKRAMSRHQFCVKFCTLVQ